MQVANSVDVTLLFMCLKEKSSFSLLLQFVCFFISYKTIVTAFTPNTTALT